MMMESGCVAGGNAYFLFPPSGSTRLTGPEGGSAGFCPMDFQAPSAGQIRSCEVRVSQNGGTKLGLDGSGSDGCFIAGSVLINVTEVFMSA